MSETLFTIAVFAISVFALISGILMILSEQDEDE